MSKKLKKLIENNELERFELKASDDEEEFENFLIEIVSQIIELRMKKGITQEELAKKMSTTQSVVSRFENMNTNPTLKSLYKILKVLGGSIKIVDVETQQNEENFDIKIIDSSNKNKFDILNYSKEELEPLEMV